MNCNQCPRKCGSNEINHSSPYHKTTLNKNQYCGKNNDTNIVLLSKSMIHMWEEPCISGINGSGALFFGGCNLGCSFCQNYEITNRQVPKGNCISISDLIDEIIKLKENKCHNINFVTASHYIPQIIQAIQSTKDVSFEIPYLWNSSAYETATQINALSNNIDIYLPDLKFFDNSLSENLANASDYFEVASKAIIQMKKQVPENKYSKFIEEDTCRCNDNINNDIKINNISNSNNIIITNETDFNEKSLSIDNFNKNLKKQNETSVISKGLIIRHLVLPGFHKDSIKILEWIEANLSNKTTISLLSQYIPTFYEKCCEDKNIKIIPSLKRKVTTYEYEKVIEKAVSLGFSDIFIQKRESAQNKYIPDF